MAFRFKQFTVTDERSTLKVGTDAVLLGSWACAHEPERILDIGTGCGLLPLMLAQRYENARVCGIDIHEGSLLDARSNFKASPWNNRLSLELRSLQDFARKNKAGYDLIISNPPFFIASLLPPDADKMIAKHGGELSYDELAEGASLLMKQSGKLAIILPYENRELFKQSARNIGLHCSREMIIRPVHGKKPNRFLSEWGFTEQEYKTNELLIRDRDHNFTEEYKMLTGAFYLAH